MHISTGALIMGALGLIYGIWTTRRSRDPRGERLEKIGAVGLLMAAIVLIVIPWALGAPW